MMSGFVRETRRKKPKADLPPVVVVVGGYSYILALRVCAAGKGMVFMPFGLV